MESKLCACCGRPINRKRPAIASVTRGEKREGYWCQDCWDNDPRAVEQYRGIGGPTQHAAIVSYVTTAGSPDRLPSSFRQMIKSFVHKRD